MEEQPITALEFEERLAALCLSSGGSGFPRRRRDRQILFRSIVQSLDRTHPSSEQMLNTMLQQWLSDVGAGLDVDHVTLRRYLVDEEYLRRNADGTAYEVRLTGRGEIPFDPAVDGVDASAVVQAARVRVAERKQRYV